MPVPLVSTEPPGNFFNLYTAHPFQWLGYGLWMLLFGLVIYIILSHWPTPPEVLTVYTHPVAAWQSVLDAPVLVQTPPSDASPQGLAIVEHAGTPKESVTPVSGKGRSGSKETHRPASGKKTFTGTLNLNTATVSQLQQLPGIGPKMAERIIAYRKQHGRFQHIQELMDVEGIGPKKFAKLAPHCAL